MRLKKLTALITLIATITPTSLIFAEKGELPDAYMDDIFRFDLNEEFKSDEVVVENGEALGGAEALAVALGYMSLDREGNFRGEDYLTPAEYKESIEKLFGTAYREELSGSTVTYETVLKGLVDFLGYSAETEYGGKSVKDVAFQLKILAEDVSTDKIVTRKAYAGILQNVYDIPIYRVDYVSDSEYSFFEGETVLEEQNIHIVKGYVNAVWGIDVFSVSAPAENVIEIDNVKYDAGDIEAEDYLGMQVSAYAMHDEEEGLWKLLYIEQHKNCDRIYEALMSVSEITDSEIFYETEEGKIRRADISGLEYIIINGEHKRDIKSISDIDFEKAEGFFSLSKTSGEKYNTLIVWDFESFTTSSVNAEKMKINMDFGATYNGEAYIDLPEDEEDAYIGIYVDGKKAGISDIKEGMAVSVIQTEDKLYNLIYASSKMVDSKIGSCDDYEIYLDSERYIISDDYYDAPDAVKLKVNSSGTFYITYFGTVAGYKMAKDGEINYGYLKATIIDSDDGDEKIMLKIFTHKSEWQRFICSEKITLDGKKVEAVKAYSSIAAGEGEFIRYKLNDDGEVTFIDTIISNIEEKDDEKQLKKVLSGHSTTFVWTKGSYLKDTNYKFKGSSTMFMLPDDRTKEDKYTVISSGTFKTDGTTSYTLDLYTADEYMYCDLVVCRETSQASRILFYVNDVYDTVDEDDEPIKAISGFKLNYESSGKSNYIVEEKVLQKMAESNIQIKKNSAVWLGVTNGDVTECIEAINIDDDYEYVNGATENYIGNVVKVDKAQRCFMVEVNGKKITKEINSINSIYIKDLSSPKSELVAGKFEDIQPGDRIIGQNGWGVYYGILILKK